MLKGGHEMENLAQKEYQKQGVLGKRGVCRT